MQALRWLRLLLFCLGLSPLAASAWDRGVVERFATLPVGSPAAEGITADKAGNIYVATFDPSGQHPGQLIVFDPSGNLVRAKDIAGASTALLGLDFHPKSGKLLVIDFGAGKVLTVDPVTGASSVFATVTGSSGLNALTFDKEGNVYISDSFQGIIWKTGPRGGAATAWVTSPLLATAGVPPFGANGLGFNKAFDTLYVANTGNDTVVQIPVSHGNPGTPSVLTNSINGADGLVLDDDDNIWVCANQADEIVVIDKTGKVISKLGDFNGIDRDGAPIGFLFPASLVRRGDFIYVTNLSLDLRPVVNAQAVDSQWAAQVTTNTVSRIAASIRPNPD
jgi:SMP-30/Gluconolactonase/LRE-like region